MKYILSIILVFSFLLAINAQDCTSCPAGSAVTLDASSYPATASFQWTCTNGFTSTLQNPVFYPNSDCTCNLIVTEATCMSYDTIQIEVCDCESNNPCVNVDYDGNTDCVTITNTGNNNSTVVSDITQWKDDNGAYATYTGTLCDCDIFDSLHVDPYCLVSGSTFIIGGQNISHCPNVCLDKVTYNYASGGTLVSYTSCTQTIDYIFITESDWQDGGNALDVYFESNTDEGDVITIIHYTYNGNGVSCSNITSEVTHVGKIYKDIWGKRTVTYSDDCPDEVCEIELDIPQQPDECILIGLVEKITFSGCSGFGYYAKTWNGFTPTSYQWYRDGTAISGETDNKICLNGQPYGEYCCEITDAAGCTISPCKIYQATCANSVNISESGGILTATPNNCTGTASYEWFKWDGTVWVTIGTNSNTYDTGGEAGDYKVKLTCSGDGCIATDTYTYIVDCTASVQLTTGTDYIQANVSDCGGTTINYAWKYWDGNIWTTVQTTNTTSTIDQYYPTQSGLHKVSITCDGCSDEAQINWTMNDPCTDFSVSISGQTSGLCTGSSYTYSYTTINGTSPFTQIWKIDGSQVATTSTYTYTPNSTGNYTLSVTVTDAEGCEYTDSKVLNVITCCSMSVSVSPATITVCENENATFTATPSGGASPYSYSWTSQISGGSVIGEGPGNPKTINKSSSGTYNIAVTVTDDNGCQASDNSTMTVDNCSDCECTPGLTLDNDCVLHGTFSGDGCPDFSWQLQYSETGTGWYVKLSGTTGTDFTYTPEDNGYYRLTIWEDGCTGSDSPIVYVGCACSAPSFMGLEKIIDGGDINSGSTTNLRWLEDNDVCEDFTFNTKIKFLPSDASGTIAYNGDVSGNTTFDLTATDLIDLTFSNIDDGQTSTVTFNYCNYDYDFYFVHNCCYYDAAASLKTEGCYTESDGGDLTINMDIWFENESSQDYTIKHYINGIYVYPATFQNEPECGHENYDVGPGGWLSGLDMSTVLTQYNNTLYIEIWDAGINTLIFTSGTLLTFDANNCP